MADGDSIFGAVADAGKDLVKETVHQVVGSGASAIKTASQQVGGFDTTEHEQQKKADEVATFQRIKAIEAEMAQIGAQSAQKKGPEIANSQTQNMEEVVSNKSQTVDEASRQAVGRAEQGRNFKG